MAQQTPFETELAELLVATLELEDIGAAEIDPAAPLFGHEAGSLGLDSIDALEIALAAHQRFGVELRADDDQNNKIFATLRTLATHLQGERVAS